MTKTRTETDSFARFVKQGATTGGLRIDSTSTGAGFSLVLVGAYSGAGDATPDLAWSGSQGRGEETLLNPLVQ